MTFGHRPARDFPYFDAPPIGLAHRGGALHPDNRGRENTLEAFATAVGLGFRYVETDVHATRDGVVVAFHDATLERVTDGSGAIAELTWEQVSRVRIAGRYAVPRLDECLTAFPDTRFNIDVKAPEAVRPLWQLIQERGVADRVCVGSFSMQRLRAFRRLSGGRVATAAGPAEVAALRFRPGRVSPGRDIGQVLQVPETIVWPVRHTGSYGAGRTVTRLVTPALVSRAHARGMQVHVWTVDDRDTMRRLLDLGVDGLVSDRIDVLAEVLAERGAWPPTS
jgi:glycerophosphoryl diester phosphodiesterase